MARSWDNVLRAAMIGTAAGFVTVMTSAAFADDAKPAGYQGVPRPWLFNPNFNEIVDTLKYKKAPPYTIGFSNASISNAWRVAFQHGVLWSAAQHKDVIQHFIVTDDNNDPTKQISDIQELIIQRVDLLLIASSTEVALHSVVVRALISVIQVVMVVHMA